MKYGDARGPDGYSTWDEFKNDHMTRGNTHNPFKPNNELWLEFELFEKRACNIDTDHGLISLYPDGTWAFDCAPDWDGSS